MTSDNSVFRLPADISLGPVQLQVADLARSIEYYSNILGLRVLDNADKSAVLGYETGMLSDGIGVGELKKIPLVELQELANANPVPRNGRLGLYHFAILLPTREDLGALLEHLAQADQKIGMADHAVSEAIYLTDPDGLGIEVYSDRTRSEWKLVDGQIHMVTEHLDPMNLVSAAREAGVVWNGIPKGTTMGHIHLHVGNIEDGAQLYHRIMGFDKTVWEYPGALFMSAGGYHHHLAINTWARGATEPAENDAQLLKWNLVVPAIDDIRNIESRLEGTTLPIEFLKEGDSVLLIKNQWGTWVRVSVQ